MDTSGKQQWSLQNTFSTQHANNKEYNSAFGPFTRYQFLVQTDSDYFNPHNMHSPGGRDMSGKGSLPPPEGKVCDAH